MHYLIDFYLYQTPSRFDDAVKALTFARQTGLGERFALEIRNTELLGDDALGAEFLKKCDPDLLGLSGL